MTTDDPAAKKQQIIALLAQNTNLSAADAKNLVDRTERNIEVMKQKAKIAAEEASKAAAKGALATFVMLVVGGGVCAGMGGVRGATHYTEKEII